MPRRDDEDEYDQYEDDRPPARHRGGYEDDHDPGYDDYEERPRRRGGRAEARERVSLPAIFLMIIGLLGFGVAAVNIAMIAAGMDDGNPFAQNDPAMKDDPAYKMGQVIGGVLSVSWGLIVFFGGLQMKGLKNRSFVAFASVWAMLPCNLCCLLGLPFGIWALVTINDESVRRAF